MRAQKKSLYSCNKIGFNEEIFYFFMIFLRKASVVKGVDGKCFKFKWTGLLEEICLEWNVSPKLISVPDVYSGFEGKELLCTV